MALTRTDVNTPEERVVLLDDGGAQTGTALKREVHHHDTPLHLAFSCYLFDAAGSLLVTRRAGAKTTWPGAWTNSFCGHPGPGEDIRSALARRATDELGLPITAVRTVLASFRYRAVMPNGIVENEVCPVFAAVVDGDPAPDPAPDPAEVGEYRWEPWPHFRDTVLSGEREVSPWCAEQVPQLAGLGDDPRAWPAAPWADLPPAASPTP